MQNGDNVLYRNIKQVEESEISLGTFAARALCQLCRAGHLLEGDGWVISVLEPVKSYVVQKKRNVKYKIYKHLLRVKAKLPEFATSLKFFGKLGAVRFGAHTTVTSAPTIGRCIPLIIQTKNFF